jgi:hypothetical protein
MKHNQYEERLLLYIYKELTGEELHDFERHLHACSRCRKELEEMKQLNLVLDQCKTIQLSDALIQEARRELAKSLKSERKVRSLTNTIIETIYDFVVPRYKVALGGATLIATGILVGYLVFQTDNNSMKREPVIAQNKIESAYPLSDESRISNLQFSSSNPISGEVEFTFDAIMPVHMKGRINDPNIQKILAYALISDQNPGVRLQSVSALASETRSKEPDAEVMDALISAVKFDKNPGVRKQALEALEQYSSNSKVKEALLDVLMHDESSGLRIAAINILTKRDGEMIQKDSALLKVLRTTLTNDNNNYIRLRSQAVLKEIVK